MPQSLTTLQSTALGPVLTVSGVSPTVAVTTTAYPGSATAANPAGGETITITGTGFNAGVKVYVGSTICTTTYVSATSLTFTSPANSVGSYVLYVYNTDGTNGASPAGITYSALPVWVTAAGALSSASQNIAYSTSVSATGDTIVYSMTTGSLPTGLSLNASTGAITGTPTVAATSTFSIIATDAQNQAVARSFSILVAPVILVEYLVVAGGGGGGWSNGGGGGAGGYRTASGFAVYPGSTYTATVGAGGGGVSTDTRASNGTNSVFSSITATGGGAGGGAQTAVGTGSNGGSGGGGGNDYPRQTQTAGGIGNSGNYTPAEGTNGGSSQGGGGGADTAGANGSSNGVGGAGKYNSISGSTVAYAGGGGGCTESATDPVLGGVGGGGNGQKRNSTAATSGSTNKGGGGGGGANSNSGSGGSGIVILRYADTYAAAASTTGSPTITVSGGYRIYIYTGTGNITF
jgi:hypothetical protein